MRFKSPLKEGLFLKRYKRFFADIEYEGKIIVAHVPNTGSMETCLSKGAPCRFSLSDNPKRKLKYTLEMVKPESAWVGINTQLPNKIVREAFENKQISHWKKFKCVKSEIKINNQTRLDMVLWKNEKYFKPTDKIPPEIFKTTDHKFHFIEVKNVTLKHNGLAKFPDAVTTRGQKHLDELINMIDLGHSSEIVFTIQRKDIKGFSSAHHIDPEYGKKLIEAKKKGVKITPLLCSVKKSSIEIDTSKQIKIIFSNDDQ